MAKPGYVIIAEHFGTDTETVRDHEYQPGTYTKPVYSFGNKYYSGGKQKPKPTGWFDDEVMEWKKEISSYDGKSIIWVAGEQG